MVATYRAAAKFIQKLRAVPALSGTLFFNVSFVGSESLAEELASISPALCTNVYVTQVVPLFDSGATGVRRYREQLAKYQPQAQPGFVSLEGFIVGSIFVEALRRVGPALTTEKLVDTLEQIDGLDLGFGTKIELLALGAPGLAQGLGHEARRELHVQGRRSRLGLLSGTRRRRGIV